MFARHTQKVHDDHRGQLHCEIIHEIKGLTAWQAVNQDVADVLDPWTQHFNGAHGEGASHQVSQPRMFRRISEHEPERQIAYQIG